MGKIAYMEGKATARKISDEIDRINMKLKKRGKRKRIRYEGTGSPMRWTIWETTLHGVSNLLVNATSKEAFLYIQGMALILTIV